MPGNITKLVVANQQQKNHTKTTSAPTKTHHPIPYWFMRQAGRYLPEYQKIRQHAGSFLSLCFHPDWAAEVTLQPLRRFDCSAAIIFSDILVVPYALGMDLNFHETIGPILNPEQLPAILEKPFDQTAFLYKLQPVFQALHQTRLGLIKEFGPNQKDLIGFAGAPFTLACYMIDGKSVPGFPKTLSYMQQQPKIFQQLMALLEQAIAVFLIEQLHTADLVMLFDSWAGLVPADNIISAVYQPHQRIIKQIKTASQKPIIAFPKSLKDFIKQQQLNHYQTMTQADIIALAHTEYYKENLAKTHAIDLAIDLVAGFKQLPKHVMLQGNLSPEILLQGGTILESEVRNLLDKVITSGYSDRYIFNLGHGIDKRTPIAHVEQLVQIIKSY